jgi:hypothetical protein
MNLWYLFGGFIVFCIAAPHLIRASDVLPQAVQNAIALVIFLPVLLGMVWAFWFMFTGHADPSVLGDYIRR